jgi:uncharacterized protein with PQ loop repeat
MVLSGALSLPQLIRIWRTKAVTGVSVLTWLLSASCAGLWCVYGAILPIFPQIPGNAMLLLVSALIIASLVKEGLSLLWPLLTLLACLAFGGVALWLDGVSGIGWLAFAVSIARSAPQLWVALRAPSVSGVSRDAWILTAGASGSWLVYGVLDQDFPVVGSGGGGLMIAISIVVIVWLRDAPVEEPAI